MASGWWSRKQEPQRWHKDAACTPHLVPISGNVEIIKDMYSCTG